ncbi:MAG: hypothetical protein BGO28_01220 [Alphaproteobacteria bacterium 43-37]|nr:MAG: hypothetical protein BGO28_01220 [Alphaproteobacteria bacterium 43-37]
MLIAFGYFLAVAVGFSLGVFGTGGAILTIPIFVYIWQFQNKQAIASGFVIVVLVGLIAAWKHYKDGHINFKLLILFAPTAMLGTFFGVSLSHDIPDGIQLLMLAIVMITSALLMLIPYHTPEEASDGDSSFKIAHPILFCLLGLSVGIIVGLVGIGGGFIILPILVSLVHVPMRQAIGTTLMIAILNAAVGALSCIQHVSIPWEKVLAFAAIAIAGGVTGAYFNSKLPVPILRKAFATILILVASFIAYENVLFFAKGCIFAEVELPPTS